MKRIIDIDEKILDHIKDHIYSLSEIDVVCETIANGIPYEEKPQGKWIELSNHRHKCSKCNNSADTLANLTEQLSNFCPNCGAKMKNG